MAGVIREKRQLLNKQIGVVGASTAAVDYAESMKRNADQLTNKFVNLANQEAKRKGDELGNSLTDYRTINPTTGEPEALDKMPATFGTTAAQAFQDSVNTNFEQSITSEIDGMSAKAAILHPLDADAYADAFSASVNLMKEHATGRYATLIDRYSTKYLASTKLNIQAKQTKANNEALKADLINSNEIASNKIRKLSTAKADYSSRKKAINAQLDILKSNKDAGILIGKEYHDQISIVNNNATLGSLENFLFRDANQSDLPKLTAFYSYLNSPTDSMAAKLDNNTIVVPTQYDDEGLVAINEMTLREYASLTVQRLSETNNNQYVLSEMKKVIDSITAQRTQQVVSNNIAAERRSNSVKSSMRAEFTSNFEVEFMPADGENTQWFNYLNKNKKIIKRHIGMTEVGADNSDPTVSKADYAKILTTKYKSIANQSLTYVLNQVEDSSLREEKLIVIRALSTRGKFKEQYTNLAPDIKKTITKEEFEFLAKTHETMSQVTSADTQFSVVFEDQSKKSAVVFGALVTKLNQKAKIKLDLDKIKAAEKLEETSIKLGKEYLNAGSNTDLFGTFEDGESDGTAITTTIKQIQSLFKKEIDDIKTNKLSPHNLKNIKTVKNNLILKYTNGLMANVIGDLDQKFTFGEDKRVLQKNDINKIQTAILSGKLNDSVPKELHTLFEAIVVDGKSIIPVEALEKSFGDIAKAFSDNTASRNKINKNKIALDNIRQKTDVATIAEETILENSILGPISERKDEWVDWYLTEPFILPDGQTNPIWEKTLKFAQDNNRLPKRIVTLLNNVGSGRETKLPILGRAIQIYKMLSEMKVPDKFDPLSIDQSINTVSGNYLVGNKVTTIAMDNIKYAINISGNESNTADILAKLETYNDGAVRQNEKNTFFKNIETAYLNDSSLKNRPTSVIQMQNKVFSNTRINQDMTDWADNLIATGRVKNEDEFKDLYLEEIKNRYPSSSIVYSPSSMGGFVTDEGEHRSMHSISKWIPEPEKQSLWMQEIAIDLPASHIWGNQVTTKNLETQTLGESDINDNTFARSSDKPDIRRAENSKLIPTYLMPVSVDKNSKTYRAITTKVVGDLIEVSYVIDPTDPSKFLEFTIDDATITRLNDKSDMTYDQKLEARIAEIENKIESPNTDVMLKADMLKKQNLLKKEREIRNNPEIISSDNSATIEKNYEKNSVNISEDAISYLQVAEGFSSILKDDNLQIKSQRKLRSFGHGMQYQSLTSAEKSLIKDKDFITKPEALAVLKVRVGTIRNTWIKALKGDGMDYNNLPAKTRIAMISFGFQLDMSNVMSTKGIKAWPLFMESIRNASKHPFNSNEQKDFLLEAQENMLFNTNKKGEKTSTAWSKQTPDRADVVSKMILG